MAYAEALPNEQGTSAGFVTRAASFFAHHGISIREVITDNALNYTRSVDFAAALASIGARHLTIRPHAPGRTAK